MSELVEAARAYCAALDQYDRKSTPHLLRVMTVARRRMRDAYARENQDEQRDVQSDERRGS